MGVVGYGYWGPNIVRNFNSTEGCQVVKICDGNKAALDRAAKAYPEIQRTSNINEVLSDASINAIAVVTPVSTHFEIAKQALENGKHVFVEKPFTATVPEAEELIELAERKNLKIVVDHTFLFTGAVRKIKQLVDDGILGSLYYYDSTRVNLGLFQHDVNVLWDLAPHDISIMDHLIDAKPEAVVAAAGNHFTFHEYVAYTTIYFENQIIAHINVNWLSPVKVRTTLVGGERRMLVWNDLNPDEKIRVYDRGIELKSQENLYDLLVGYRSGDMWAPRVEQTEALRLEAQYFIDCIHNEKVPFNDGHAGYRVVRILDAAAKSIKKRGELVYL
jgi:predicted dehydrogenase